MKLRQLIPLIFLTAASCKGNKAASKPVVANILKTQINVVEKTVRDTTQNALTYSGKSFLGPLKPREYKPILPLKINEPPYLGPLQLKNSEPILPQIKRSETPIADTIAYWAKKIVESKRYGKNDCKLSVRVALDSADVMNLGGESADEAIGHLRRSQQFKRIKIKNYNDLRNGDLLAQSMQQGLGWEKLSNEEIKKAGRKYLQLKCGHIAFYNGADTINGKIIHMESSYKRRPVLRLEGRELQAYRAVEMSKTAQEMLDTAFAVKNRNQFKPEEYDKAAKYIVNSTTGLNIHDTASTADVMKIFDKSKQFKKINIKSGYDYMKGDILISEPSKVKGYDELPITEFGYDGYLKKGFFGIYTGRTKKILGERNVKHTHSYTNFKEMQVPEDLSKDYKINLKVYRPVDTATLIH